ncbi:molybdopterin-dependent oxidoreductase [Catellatospora bangladeshensis]|uniref:Oxidoreductase n=1 Tax=Catellatospora bangladeshensis TaxID=310355 RepID=A0A8J3NJI5_9ACTN|nr:molybdopterin-dependent oxidoreductase [Catellatospora bangladeshensis]GIF83097.1 oxidoreductase [Catellatospora bangladeshensis]
MRRRLSAALTGLLAAAGGVCAAELTASLTRPAASPLVTIGGTVIDATPTPVKEYAVRTFGTYDKPLLITGIVGTLGLLAALVGVLAMRHRTAAVAAIGLAAAAGAAAALTRPDACPLDALPALLAGGVTAALLTWLIMRLPGSAEPAPSSEPVPAGSAGRPDGAMVTSESGQPSGGTPPAVTQRRRFLIAAGTTSLGIVAGAAGTALLRRHGTEAADAARDAVTLPAPADPAPPAQTTPGFYTATKDFYRVDIALTLPRIDPRAWSLTIGGMVDRPARLSFDDLLKLPLIERDVTLNCVSNEVGGPYIGTARWLGVPLAAVLRAAGVQAGADQVVARAADGITIGTPAAAVLDGRDAMLALAMNGQPLPAEHGFPARMLTPGLYGYVGAAKWITSLELTTFAGFDAYWVQRGWAAQAPVKTASRIDRPTPLARLTPGPVAVAGVAWAQRRGISAVQVQVDDAPWRPARLLPTSSTDTWVQWVYDWTATPGNHTLRVRAVDGTGAMQAEHRAAPFPDGATGWHTRLFTVDATRPPS